MSKRSFVAIVMMLCMSFSLLVGCSGDGGASVADNTEALSVAEDVNSEVSASEEVSETSSEETTETISEEAGGESVEEVVEDYSITAIEARINEIAESYPDEDSRQIAAVVIGTNAKYMTEEEVEEALNTYGFTKEEVNELFIQYFETKGRMIGTHDEIVEGSVAPMPDYASMSPIYLYCLNSNEYEECVVMENAVNESFENNTTFGRAKEINIINDEKSKSIAKMLVYGTTTSYQKYYPECLPFVTE